MRLTCSPVVGVIFATNISKSPADVSVTAVILRHPFSAIQQIPVQAVETDAVIESPVIAVHHVGKQVRCVLRSLAFLDLPRRIGHLGMEGLSEQEGYYQSGKPPEVIVRIQFPLILFALLFSWTSTLDLTMNLSLFNELLFNRDAIPL